ncbi:MAG: type II secretion system F family protein [Candidatus Korobacteraceae bacterium]|jgi:type IV pilus assembly protein PilC
MPVFTYHGKNAAGKAVRNERAAENKQVLRAALGKEGIKIDKISAKEGRKLFGSGGGKVKITELAVFFRQFSVMIDAGLPLVQCLEILGTNQENPALRNCLAGVRSSVEGGATLANAMRGYPKIFDDLTTNMVEAGETGGILDTILQRLAIYVEKNLRLRQAVKSALIYPVSVITIAVLVVGALLKFVVPIFANMFVGLGVPLPAATKFVIDLSHFIGDFWWVIILSVVGFAVTLVQVRKMPEGRLFTDRILLKIPVFGPLLLKIAVARFTRTLGTLITSGVPILEGLDVTARTSGNAVIQNALFNVRKSIEQGRTIVDPLRESKIFPNMVTQMIGVGEATGAMDSMLQKIADFYEDEVDAATKNLLTLLEPMLIAFLGVSVGGIVISLYMPLFSMISKLAG